MMLDHVQRMSRYNRWANQRLYDACSALPPDEFGKERSTFFRSIAGTLNHLLVTDRMWIDRIAGRPFGGGRLDDVPYPELTALREARAALDEEIMALAAGQDPKRLTGMTTYRMQTRPEDRTIPTAICWLHMFNHQTHHRGQVHDQLSQTTVAPPPLDLIYMVYEEMR